jgi:hypothetical protein
MLGTAPANARRASARIPVRRAATRRREAERATRETVSSRRQVVLRYADGQRSQIVADAHVDDDTVEEEARGGRKPKES